MRSNMEHAAPTTWCINDGLLGGFRKNKKFLFDFLLHHETMRENEFYWNVRDQAV